MNLQARHSNVDPHLVALAAALAAEQRVVQVHVAASRTVGAQPGALRRGLGFKAQGFGFRVGAGGVLFQRQTS